MNKPKWMPENIYSNRGGYDDSAISFGYNKGSLDTAKAILEYQIKYWSGFEGQEFVVAHFQFMLKEIEEALK
jgi:hypothetical protein